MYTNAIGVVIVDYTSPNGKPPDSFVVSYGPHDDDGIAKQADPIVWSATVSKAQVRIRKMDGTWWANISVNFSWIAVWN